MGAPYQTGVSGTTYLDKTVTNGTTYFYTFTAVNRGGVSPIPNEAGATPVAPDFSLPASPAGVSIAQGVSGTSTITVAPLNGFADSVTFTASSLPSGPCPPGSTTAPGR